MRLELAQTLAVGSAHPTVILYLIMLDYLGKIFHQLTAPCWKCISGYTSILDAEENKR